MTAGLRTVIVGAGLMGRWHAHAVRHSGGRVIAVVDRDRSRAEALARRHGAAVGTSLDSFVELDSSAVVHVCTPLATHEDLASAAIDRGAHVLVEKPIAPDTAAATRMLDRAAESGVLLCPVHQFVFQSGTREAQTMMDRIAPLRHIDALACSAGAEDHAPGTPAAIAAAILPHPLSLLRAVAADHFPAFVWSAISPVPGEIRVTGAGDDVTASILVSMSGRPTRNTLHLIGEGGSIHLDLFHGFAVIETPTVSRWRKITHPLRLPTKTLTRAIWNLQKRAVRREPAYPGLRELVSRFYAAARTGSPAPISASETLDVAAACDAIAAQLPR